MQATGQWVTYTDGNSYEVFQDGQRGLCIVTPKYKRYIRPAVSKGERLVRISTPTPPPSHLEHTQKQLKSLTERLKRKE